MLGVYFLTSYVRELAVNGNQVHLLPLFVDGLGEPWPPRTPLISTPVGLIHDSSCSSGRKSDHSTSLASSFAEYRSFCPKKFLTVIDDKTSESNR